MASEDYEASESIAIAAGKAEMNSKFMSRHFGPKGMFFVMTTNKRHYPNSVKLGTVDGVGTKLFTHQWTGRYELMGYDLLAMCFNDFAVLGRVEPDTVTIYFATQEKIREHHMGQIMNGIDSAMERGVLTDIIPDVEIINYGKFETASLEEMLAGPVPGKSFDVSASVDGFMFIKDENGQPIPLPTFQPSDGWKIIGFASSGLHSNGYTAARHRVLIPAVEYRKEWKSAYEGKFALDDLIPDTNQTVADALLHRR